MENYLKFFRGFMRKKVKVLRIMKLTLMLLILGVLQVSANVYSQNAKINVQVSEMDLSEFLWELQQNSEVVFVYRTSDLEGYEKISLEREDASITEILDEVLSNTDLEYRFDKDVIVITKKENHDDTPETTIEQQEKKIIKGKVTDKDGTPLPGVSVVIKGTSVGVATDIDGNYALEMEQDKAVLIYSFVGMLSQEVVYIGQADQNIILLADTEQMDEVVVTGYQTISRERASGSFQNVKVDKLMQEKSYSNVVQLLEGEVAGLYIAENAEGKTVMTLRGESNFDGADVNRVAPLVILDGFEISGVATGNNNSASINVTDLLKNINPNDIENITVLKDASAASIWGARAGNGVIVITTKRGKHAQKANINFSSSLRFQQKPNYHDAYAAGINTVLEFDKWAVENGMAFPSENYYLPEAQQAYADYDSGNISEAELDATINRLKQNDLIHEYSDLFLRNSIEQQYSLSINQAVGKSSYYASFNYVDEDSNMKGVGNNRYSTYLNVNSELMEGIRFSSKISYAQDKIKNNGAESMEFMKAYERILDDNGNYIPQFEQMTPKYEAELDAKVGGYPYDFERNAKREFDNADNETVARNIGVQAQLDFDIYKGLTGMLSFNYQYGRSKTQSYFNEETNNVRNAVNGSDIFDYFDHDNDPLTPDELQFVKFGIPTGGMLDRNEFSNRRTTYRSALNYSGFIDKEQKQHVTALAGADYSEDYQESHRFSTLYGYNSRTLTHKSVDFANTYYNNNGFFKRALAYDKAGIGKNKNRYLSYYANLGYTYNGKYTFNASWRLDDSNLFGSSSKYRNVPLWSVGGKWVISEEKFIDVSFLNKLVLRATYGIGGNIDRTTSPYLMVRYGSATFPRYDYSTIYSFANQELRWEKTSTLNAGFDFALFNNRLFGTFDYYNRYSEDVMSRGNLDPTDGIKQQKRNFAEISNKGFELTLNYAVFQNKNWGWDANFVMSYNKSKIEKYDAFSDAISWYTGGGNIEGDPLSGFYAYRWAGLSDTGAPQVYDENNNVVDHNSVITSVDAIEYAGQRNPKYFGSVTNRLRYKGFTLGVQLTYKLGHKFRLAPMQRYYIPTTGRYMHEDMESRWQKPGDESITNVPALAKNVGHNYGTYFDESNIRVKDASHIRIQSLNLNYTLKPELAKKIYMQGVTVGITGQNLGLLWTANSENIDPDRGNRLFTYKTRPTYTFNLYLNF